MPLTDNEKYGANGEDASQELARRLDGITLLLRRMLVLAELSASGMDVDRQLLQENLERIKAEIDRVADEIDP